MAFTAEEPAMQMAENLRETMRCFSAGQGEVAEANGVSLVFAGTELAIFNSAVLFAPVEEEERFDILCREAGQYFRNKRASWSFWVCEGLLAPKVRKRFGRRLEAHRLSQASTSPGMYARGLPSASRELPRMVFRRVHDTATRQSFCHILSMSFQGPANKLTAVYSREEFWNGSFRGYIGSVDGLDVTTASVVVAGDSIGIYAVATLPSFMRRGCAEAVIRHAITDARSEFGDLPLVLQSTMVAVPLYQRLGFVPLTTFSLFCSE